MMIKQFRQQSYDPEMKTRDISYLLEKNDDMKLKNTSLNIKRSLELLSLSRTPLSRISHFENPNNSTSFDKNIIGSAVGNLYFKTPVTYLFFMINKIITENR